MHVVDWLHKQALHRPEKTALIDIDADRSPTYGEFDERASRFAEAARALGLREGERKVEKPRSRSLYAGSQ